MTFCHVCGLKEIEAHSDTEILACLSAPSKEEQLRTENQNLWACLRNMAQVVQLAAMDERLDAETRSALDRSFDSQLSAHSLVLPETTV